MSGRAERAKVALALRSEGKTAGEIAAVLGVSRSYAGALFGDPDGSKERARKASYAGTCQECGGRTDGSNGRDHAPTRCQSCQNEYQRSDEYAFARTKWTRERIIAAIRWWYDIYGEPPAVADWNPHRARHELGDEDRARRGEAAISAGRVPWHTIVYSRFGSWNAAIRAAGFTPRANVGTKENVARRRVAA